VKEKKNGLSSDLTQPEPAPTRLVPRYVYRLRVLIPWLARIRLYDPNLDMSVRSRLDLLPLPYSKIGFGSLSLPPTRLAVQNVLGFRTAPALNRVENTRHALGLSY